jgi:hypothetical protein
VTPQKVRNCEHGVHVTGGAATGEKIRRHDRLARGDACIDTRFGAARDRGLAVVTWRDLRRASRSARANDKTIPTATRFDSSAVPPDDRNGSGTPRTGRIPTTTPMLMAACPIIQNMMPPVTIRIMRLSVSLMIRRKRTAKKMYNAITVGLAKRALKGIPTVAIKSPDDLMAARELIDSLA